MAGWLATAALWAAVTVRFRQRSTRQDWGLLVMFTGMAVGFTLARPEIAQFIDVPEMALPSLLKRCTAMLGAVGVALYMSAVAGRRGWTHITATVTVICLLIVTHFAGAYRWAETDVFFADPARFTLSNPGVWAGWAHFLLWYLYVAFVTLALATTCIAVLIQVTGVLRTQLGVFALGAIWCAVSPVYALAGIAGLIPYDLDVDRTFLLMPSILLLVIGMGWQAIHRGRASGRAWWLYTRLRGLWRMLVQAQPEVVLNVEGGPWRVRLHRRVVECLDAMRQLSAYLPEGTFATGRVDADTAALRLRESLIARKTGDKARDISAGAPAAAGEDIPKEATWLVSVWWAWKRLERSLGPV
ncbi:MAB_1171c family putative transporter [Nonomuraea purpurea]|uniref:MAB_1171c family putative transporter n=1 Tax=Nonomuraea purpurea TaxID=1849276 RepID=A0ABV8GL20_9ACTN